jgi:GNAT superfamily N-acetyltransferase
VDACLTVEFKIAAIEHADAVYKLIHQLEHDLPFDNFLDQFTAKINTADYRIFVAIADDRVLAFAELHVMQFIIEEPKRARLTAFCVDGKYRNKQIGSDFIFFLESQCRELGCVSLELTSNARRTDAHRFYERLGFLEYSKMYIKRLT